MKKDRSGAYAHEVNDIPEEEHWMILQNTSVSYDDPYHNNHYGGTPQTITTQYMDMIIFYSKEEVEAWVAKETMAVAYASKKPFKVIHVTPYKVKSTVQITLE